jgi:hypothetical protein
MGRFWNFVRSSAAPCEGKLPLVHSTDLYCFRDIRQSGKLEPTKCDVYREERLLYFFYGRPSYRPHLRKGTVTASAFLPICLVMSRTIINKAVRMMPFDTGAFERKMMHPPMHDAMRKEEFELDTASDAPTKTINVFYGNESNYYNAKAKPQIQGCDHLEDLEIDCYFRLLHHRANTEPDDRVSAIEVQIGSPIGLTGHVHAAILPKPFLHPRSGIAELVERWGGLAIPYNVKEEFVPREIQGAIFDRLTEYLYQERFLELN